MLTKKLKKNNIKNNNIKIITINLQTITPIPKIIQLQKNITKKSTTQKIISHFKNKKTNLIIYNKTPNITNLHNINKYIQTQLLLTTLNITTHVLRTNKTFITKIFRKKNITLLYSQLHIFFPLVTIFKPRNNKNSNIETFIVYQNYSPPTKYIPNISNPLLDHKYDTNYNNLKKPNRIIIPFLTYENLNNFNSDRTYPLNLKNNKNYIYHPPTQKPIKPPYKKTYQLKKTNQLTKIINPTKTSSKSSNKNKKNTTTKNSTINSLPNYLNKNLKFNPSKQNILKNLTKLQIK